MSTPRLLRVARVPTHTGPTLTGACACGCLGDGQMSEKAKRAAEQPERQRDSPELLQKTELAALKCKFVHQQLHQISQQIGEMRSAEDAS